MVTILIGGDVCPIGRNSPFFRQGNAEALFNDLLPDFRSADLVVANLECPLISTRSPITKTGPVFGEDIACVNGIRAAGIDVVSLANNHIMDHGVGGLESTLAACEAAGISTLGAGPNLEAARRPLLLNVRGLRVGLLAMAEHEFSIAARNSPGASPLDLIAFVRTVRSLRGQTDYMVVLLHGGAEFTTMPSPRLKETCHFLVEMGANAVIVQHPHCVVGYERSCAGHIVYGQGALVMDEEIYADRASFHQAVLVRLEIEPSGGSSVDLVPLIQSDAVPGARRMESERAAAFLHDLNERSCLLLDDEHLEREWRRFCRERKYAYLSVLKGHNKVLRAVCRLEMLARLVHNRRRLLGTRNVVCCETHREALETILLEETNGR